MSSLQNSKHLKWEKLPLRQYPDYFGRAQRRFTPDFGVFILPDWQGSSATVVVSKKLFKKAHDRNRARRRVWAALRELSPIPNFGVVIHIRSRAAIDLVFTDLTRTLASALKISHD